MTNFVPPAEGYAGDLFSGEQRKPYLGSTSEDESGNVPCVVEHEKTTDTPRKPLELVSLADAAKPFPVDARMLWEALESNRKFTDWMEYQIERNNFQQGIDFFTKLGKTPAGKTGRPSTDYSLTIDAAKHIALMTNTSAGKAVREHFISIENAWNTPEMVMVRGLQAAQEVIRKQAERIASLADDARVARTIAIAEGLKTITEVAKINGIGPRKLFEMLSGRKILYRLRGNWIPHQEYIDLGYFVVKERTYGDEESAHLSSQTYVTGKGEVWLAKRMFPAPAGVQS
ncbi:phage antirepressor KilAC domain-containing protein [Treponema zuelzerae]|uniref:Phage antirepressor KilAC domain-containing protein n=1 Tax=Teretinema zuelzerae TaxID=156 RepID=A0AAE3JI53_9SPIR|nr:phage antirepressor KilAC domain-containing protein [Teretinema zuelzerae]MCD1654732.1 phage antirepressor KilAC domain-containing protein [Teretinema zuelzerae]